MFSVMLLELSFLKETLVSGDHECLIKIFSDTVGVTRTPRRMEKGMNAHSPFRAPRALFLLLYVPS